jgi:hypothetical protein
LGSLSTPSEYGYEFIASELDDGPRLLVMELLSLGTLLSSERCKAFDVWTIAFAGIFVVVVRDIYILVSV